MDAHSSWQKSSNATAGPQQAPSNAGRGRVPLAPNNADGNTGPQPPSNTDCGRGQPAPNAAVQNNSSFFNNNMNVKKYNEIRMGPCSELRFGIEDRNTKVYLDLASGRAEVFGTELVMGKSYEFLTGAKVAVFTYDGCVLHLAGNLKKGYVSKETAMMEYANIHSVLNQMRINAEEHNERGPIVLVVGPNDVGKSTLCRILLNYAVRNGNRLLFCDIDVGQGSLTIPGAIASTHIERPASVEDGFSQTVPLELHFGHNGPGRNNVLYKQVVAKLAEKSLEALRKENTKQFGIIINTGGWVQGQGYKHLLQTARAFEVNVILVLGRERSLYNKLQRAMPHHVNVVYLPKSSGIVERNRPVRMESRTQRLKEYFYGARTPLSPSSFEIKFQDLKLYKIGGEKPGDNSTKLFSVTPSPQILHHILAISLAKSIEDDVIGSNVAGFICVNAVDMVRQVVVVLSPQPHPLRDGILLLSELQYSDTHGH